MSPSRENPPAPGFESFGLSEPILRGVREAGFTVPSPIQAQAIPLIMAGRDLIAQAQTGTGKTAAFGLPFMSRLKGACGVEMLVVTPTRELCAQVADELFRLGRFAGVRTVAVYGGSSGYHQVDLVKRGGQVVVATPGRLLDHLDAGRLPKFTPAMVVLDEADEMLDMGFLEDIERIFKHLPAKRQTVLFSATMPPPIRALAARVLHQPATIDLTATATFQTAVEQRYYVISESERTDAVVRLIDHDEPGKALVFCRTKHETDALCATLAARGYGARALHGDIEQRQRQDVIRAFKEGRIAILVATDVAARGLDIGGVTHVFNYHLPFDQEAYVHRIGRTGRAGETGIAMTLVTPHEFSKLHRIQKAIKASFIPGEVPTATDLRARHGTRLVEAVRKQAVRAGAVEALAALTGAMDIDEAACRLISMLLAERAVRGPERIGLPEAAVRRLEQTDRPRAGDRKHRPPYKRKPFRR